MSAQRSRPEIDFPEGEPPAELSIADEIEGDGAEAAAHGGQSHR